jgi:acetyltransferase-like isoleucine patch superfamily enzyme
LCGKDYNTDVSVMEYGINSIGEGSTVFPGVILGFPSRARQGMTEYPGVSIGRQAVIRPGTVIYCEVVIGDFFQTGHNVLIREETTIGDSVSIGTATVIEGHTLINDGVNLQSMVYVPMHSVIESRVFIGPNAVLTNDRYPPHGGNHLQGPVIREGASVGANATILPGVEIGAGSLVAAGAIVTKDVPPGMLAIGAPARHRELPGGAFGEEER